MPFLTVGVEHGTAPLAVREQIARDLSAIPVLPADLVTGGTVTELVVLSTCNRTELYLFADDAGETRRQAETWLTRGNGLQAYLRVWQDMQATEHLFRVAAGLESQIVGERQILSQVREALETAQGVGTVGPNLHALFRAAISCGRQVRAASSAGRLDASIPREAVRQAQELLGGLQDKSTLLIGGGRVANLAAEALRAVGVQQLWIANRTPSRAEELAQRWSGQAASLVDVSRLIPRVDLVMSATAAQSYVVTVDDVAGHAGNRTLHVFDLAIPRDVDPAIGDLGHVELHDLEGVLPGHGSGWDEDVQRMEAIIAAEMTEFNTWYLTRRVVPVIANLRSHVEAVQAQELKRVAPQLSGLTDRERAAVESLTGRLVDKMFHHLVVRLRLAAQTDPKLVEAAEFFFLHGEGSLFPHAAEEAEAVEERDARS